MTIKAEKQDIGLVVPEYGEYLGEYESDHAEASAHLFRKENALRALLSYKKNRTPGPFRDKYIEDLEQLAKERGLTLEILHVA